MKSKGSPPGSHTHQTHCSKHSYYYSDIQISFLSVAEKAHKTPCWRCGNAELPFKWLPSQLGLGWADTPPNLYDPVFCSCGNKHPQFYLIQGPQQRPFLFPHTHSPTLHTTQAAPQPLQAFLLSSNVRQWTRTSSCCTSISFQGMRGGSMKTVLCLWQLPAVPSEQHASISLTR